MSVRDMIAPLFVPAHRVDRFAKAAASAADAIILDLEDAVPAELKDFARAGLHVDFTDKPVLVRINGPGTPWHKADLEVVAQLSPAGIMLPKAERPEEVERANVAGALVALVETVRGIAAVDEVAASGRVARMAFGSIDYAADLGCSHSRDALAHARAALLLATRLHGLPAPLDGVTTNFASPGETLADAAHARDLGFGGKLCIHPAQVEEVFEGFRPTVEEAAWARRVLSSGEGAAAVLGEMVDHPVRVRARGILQRLAR